MLTYVCMCRCCAAAGEGTPRALPPWRAPYSPSHSIPHPHVCDWAAGIELMARHIDADAAATTEPNSTSIFNTLM